MDTSLATVPWLGAPVIEPLVVPYDLGLMNLQERQTYDDRMLSVHPRALSRGFLHQHLQLQNLISFKPNSEAMHEKEAQWYEIPLDLFNQKKPGVGSEDCFLAKSPNFMKEPYIIATPMSLSATNTGEEMQDPESPFFHNGCVYQSTLESCSFYLGPNGVH